MGKIPYEKELFAEIKSPIFTKPKFTMPPLYIYFFAVTEKLVIPDKLIDNLTITTWNFLI